MEKDNVDSKKFIPFCDEDKFVLYTFDSRSLDQYIYNIHNKYLYKDTVLLTAEEIVNNRLNRKYDIVSTFPAPKEEFYRAFDMGEVLRYPKMSFIFNECIKDKYVRLYDLANYCKEYFSDGEFIEVPDFCDRRNLISKSVDFGLREQSLSNRTIISDIKNLLPLETIESFEIIGEAAFDNGRLLVDIEESVKVYEWIQKLYYIGKANKEAMDYINDKYSFYWKKNKVKELKM